jgi:hypothetical protein
MLPLLSLVQETGLQFHVRPAITRVGDMGFPFFARVSRSARHWVLAELSFLAVIRSPGFF